MKDRIKQLMESQQFTQQKFAEVLGISPASLSSIFNDRTKPTLNHVDAIVSGFPNINLRWLMYGEGDMFVSDNGSTTNGVTSSSVSQAQEQMLDFGGSQSTPPQSEVQPDKVQQQQIPVSSQYKHEVETVKILNKPQRKISEIRIFYDDQTWETFLPQK